MSKDNDISDEDKALFRESMKKVSPLRQPSRHPQAKAKPKSRSKPRQPVDTHKYHFIHPNESIRAQDDWLGAEDCIHFRRSGVSHRDMQRLRRGNLSIEAQIDLHGFTASEALAEIDQFIMQCITEGIRWVCVIHGKGHYSSGAKPVLKNVINQWLRKHPHVLAFHSAKAKHGGTGAVYVLLKTKR